MGLGLSIVYGIAKQSERHLEIYFAPIGRSELVYPAPGADLRLHALSGTQEATAQNLEPSRCPPVPSHGPQRTG